MMFFSDVHGILGDDKESYKEKFQKLSNWIQVPIYVYSDTEDYNLSGQRHYRWETYEPGVSQRENKLNCRFYLTLFHNRTENFFDRITPLKGCNCQVPSPLSTIRNSK